MKIKIEFDSKDGCTACPYCFYKSEADDEYEDFDEKDEGFYCNKKRTEHECGVYSKRMKPKFISEFKSVVEILEWCPLLTNSK